MQDTNQELRWMKQQLKALKHENKELKENLGLTLHAFEIMQSKCQHMEAEFQLTKEEFVKTSNNLQLQTDLLSKDISALKDPPHYHACVYQDTGYMSNWVIDFDKVLYTSSNIDEADFDIKAGVFTSGWGGTYTVTWDLRADNNPKERAVELYLKKNGEVIPESHHKSHYEASGYDGRVVDQGIFFLQNFVV